MNSADLAGARWRKSSHSGSEGNCVEVAFLDDDLVALRDSKAAGAGPALVFTAGDWAAFSAGMADGEFTR